MALDRGPVGSASSAGPALPAPEGAPGRSAAPHAVRSSGRSIASPSPIAPHCCGRRLRTRRRPRGPRHAIDVVRHGAVRRRSAHGATA